jgi:ubiquinone biosynthesis protein UbiJ
MRRTLLNLLQWRLNRDVGESTAARERLEELEGRSLGITVEWTGVELLLKAEQGRLEFVAQRAETGTARVRGTPLGLLKLLGDGSAKSFSSAGALLEGDAEIAQGFSEMLRLARPDWEEALSAWIGDVPAHQVARAARGFGAWVLEAARETELNLAEYLQEESRQLPAPLEVQALASDVEQLRDRVERAARRIDRLTRSIGEGEGSCGGSGSC